MAPEIHSPLGAPHLQGSQPPRPSRLRPMIDLNEVERSLNRSYRETLYLASALIMLLATITAIAALD